MLITVDFCHSPCLADTAEFEIYEHKKFSKRRRSSAGSNLEVQEYNNSGNDVTMLSWSKNNEAVNAAGELFPEQQQNLLVVDAVRRRGRKRKPSTAVGQRCLSPTVVAAATAVAVGQAVPSRASTAQSTCIHPAKRRRTSISNNLDSSENNNNPVAFTNNTSLRRSTRARRPTVFFDQSVTVSNKGKRKFHSSVEEAVKLVQTAIVAKGFKEPPAKRIVDLTANTLAKINHSMECPKSLQKSENVMENAVAPTRPKRMNRKDRIRAPTIADQRNQNKATTIPVASVVPRAVNRVKPSKNASTHREPRHNDVGNKNNDRQLNKAEELNECIGWRVEIGQLFSKLRFLKCYRRAVDQLATRKERTK